MTPHPRLRPTALAASLSLLLAPALPALAAELGGPALTVESSGDARVVQAFRFDLQPGLNSLAIGDLPDGFDAAAASFRPAGAGAAITGQRFDFALLGQGALLERAVGETVSVEQTVGSQTRRFTGTLLAAGDGLALRMADGSVRVLRSYDGFTLPGLPEGLASEPTLRYEVDATGAGPQDFTLDYAAGGLAWNAQYTGTVRAGAQGCAMALEGAAFVSNRSGRGWRDAELTLVASSAARAPERARMRADAFEVTGSRISAAPPAAPPPPAPRAAGEGYAYPIAGRHLLPDGSATRIPLMAEAPAVPCERLYIAGERGWWFGEAPRLEPDAGPDGALGAFTVQAELHFANDAASGLGQPLPAGRLRLREDDGDLLGEAQIGHTPAGEDLEIGLGEVFDLRGERFVRDLQVDRRERAMTETIEVVLRNAKAEPVTVQLRESMPRWKEWEVVETSHPLAKRDAQTAEAAIAVPAGGEVTVRYVVRYRWARDVVVD